MGRPKGMRKVDGVWFKKEELEELKQVDFLLSQKRAESQSGASVASEKTEAMVQVGSNAIAPQNGSEVPLKVFSPGYKLYSDNDILKVEQATKLQLFGWTHIDGETILYPVFLDPSHTQDRIAELLAKARL